MVRVAVVDDEAEMLEYLENSIEKAFEEMNVDVETFAFNKGSELVRQQGEMKFDIIFLDLEMPEMDGFEAARRIRTTDSKVVLVFVTNREDLVFDAFQYDVTAFVRKKCLNEEWMDAVAKAYKKAISRLSVQIFKTEKGEMYLRTNEILYFSSQGHNVTIHLINGESFRIYYTLEQLESMLVPGEFVRCHSGILVNCSHIYSIDKDTVILTGNISVVLSRHRKKMVKDALQRNLRSL